MSWFSKAKEYAQKQEEKALLIGAPLIPLTEQVLGSYEEKLPTITDLLDKLTKSGLNIKAASADQSFHPGESPEYSLTLSLDAYNKKGHETMVELLDFFHSKTGKGW